MRGVPEIDSIERGDFFEENTIIYDKNKNPIYTLFNNGKRTYISYGDISTSIKDAIISTEDKTFFENPGIDVKGLARAGINYVTGKTERIQGTSTLSQQLISITLLSKERSVKRKVQEAYLSYKLNKNYSKEKILEMYLNTLSFGNNSNGIEEASKTYFGKSAKDVGPLGASILASLPKGPTFYSPYNHRKRLMGEAYVYTLSDPDNKIPLFPYENRKKYEEIYTEFKSYLSGITLEGKDGEVRICGIKSEYTRDRKFFPDESGCVDESYDEILNFFGDIIIQKDLTLSGSTTKFALEYAIGRKDFVGNRMFEDGKIDGPTLKKIVFDGLEFEFKKYSENISHPYFVMYIKEYLESKYGQDIDINTGLRVYTTLDPELQDKAEELVKKQVAINKVQYGANSAALVSMDNTNGALLAMVGGPDYFDTENGGNNNMTLSLRQPGSSFKPFVYGLAISKYPIGPKSPVADADTSFGPWDPNNYDRKFNGIMTLEDALNYSRNIPAIKMYFLAGKEEALVQYGKDLGLKSLKENFGYGAPMAIGTSEVRPIELMQAYSVYANLGIKKDLYAIERIEDSDGNILEEHTPSEKKDPIFSPASTYIVNKILSDVDSRPEGFWRNALTVSGGRPMAVKTGTSNKDVSEGGNKKILPRDLWTAGYSPQITTVVWAGNVDGKETRGTCDGLNCAAPIWKGFMEFAHKELPKDDWKKPEGIFEYTIVKSSGKLAATDTPEDEKVSTIMAVKLTESDSGFKEETVDTLCNGPVSDSTPEGSIGKILIPASDPIIDGYDPAWKKGFFAYVGSGKLSTEKCERPDGPGNMTLAINVIDIGNSGNSNERKIIETTWSGDRNIVQIKTGIDGETRRDEKIPDGGKNIGSDRVNTTLKDKPVQIRFEVIDIYGYVYTTVENVSLDSLPIPNTTDAISTQIEENYPTENLTPGAPSLTPGANASPPTITITNPKSQNINLYSGNPLNIRFSTTSVIGRKEITVRLEDRVIFTSTQDGALTVPLDTTGMASGRYTVSVSIIDTNLKSAEKTFTLTILPR